MIKTWIAPSVIPTSVVLVAAGLSLVSLPGRAAAQATMAQREACTPDALKFCSAAIPDVDRVKVCMMAHRASLSARCVAAFPTAGPTKTAARHRKDLVASRNGPGMHSRQLVAARFHGHSRALVTDDDYPTRYHHPSWSNAARGMRMAQQFLGMACASNYLPPNACGMTQQVMSFAQ